MAEFLDSFDNRGSADATARYTIAVTSSSVTISITSAAGRNGTNGLRLARNQFVASGVAVDLLRSMPGANRYKIAFARAWSTLPPSGQYRAIATMRDSGITQCELRLYGDGTLRLYRSGTLVTGGQSTFTVTAGTRYHFEWDLTVHNTTGASELRINDSITAFTVVNQNTRVTANNTINEVGIRFIPSDSGDTSFNDDIDDLIIHDSASFVGDCRVDYKPPDGNGTYAAWTANGAASLYQCVDETSHNGDTDYASSATVNQKQTFTHGDIPVTATVKFVQQVWVAKKTDAGTRTFAPRIKSGGSEQLGTNIAPGTGYAFYEQSTNLDPATGVTWTASGLNAAEFGEEVTS